MKRILMGLAALGLATAPAMADEVKAKAKEVHHKGHRNADGTGNVKTEAKTKVDTPNGTVTEKSTTEHDVSSRLGGGTTETKTRTRERDGATAGHDAKTKTTEKVERDANGNVTHVDKKVEH